MSWSLILEGRGIWVLLAQGLWPHDMRALAFHFLIRKMRMLQKRFWNILEYSPAIVLADPTESGQFDPFSGNNSAEV